MFTDGAPTAGRFLIGDQGIPGPEYATYRAALSNAQTKLTSNLLTSAGAGEPEGDILGDITMYSTVSDTQPNRIGFTGNPGSLSCLLYTSPSPRDATLSRMPSSA